MFIPMEAVAVAGDDVMVSTTIITQFRCCGDRVAPVEMFLNIGSFTGDGTGRVQRGWHC